MDITDTRDELRFRIEAGGGGSGRLLPDITPNARDDHHPVPPARDILLGFGNPHDPNPVSGGGGQPVGAPIIGSIVRDIADAVRAVVDAVTHRATTHAVTPASEAAQGHRPDRK